MTARRKIRFRRIGENEVTAIGSATAGRGGKQTRDANRPVPFHGYELLRTLSKSGGGFAAIAYPALYRSSGVDDFHRQPG